MVSTNDHSDVAKQLSYEAGKVSALENFAKAMVYAYPENSIQVLEKLLELQHGYTDLIFDYCSMNPDQPHDHVLHALQSRIETLNFYLQEGKIALQAKENRSDDD